MNEQICATALYCVDSENIAPSSILFRMQTSPRIGDNYETITTSTCTWLERIHGTSLLNWHAPCLQMHGAVQMQQGRLLTFPNVL